MHELTLTGLDGANPLGFLAALGVLGAAENGSSAVRMKWEYQGRWRPVLLSKDAGLDTLINCLEADRRSCREDPALGLEYGGKRDLKPPAGEFGAFLVRLLDRASADQRRSVDWAAAFATDIALDNNGNTKPTALHFTAGQQQFLQMAAELADKVTPEDLREAVVGPWLYKGRLPVMGWDGTANRDYALRASNPSSDEKLGVPGADWLAIRGLIFLPTAPRGDRVATTGCVGGWKDGRFRWPLWTVPLCAEVVRTLLVHDVEGLTAAERHARGIGVVFSSTIGRSDQGGYGSFEPSSEV